MHKEVIKKKALLKPEFAEIGLGYEVIWIPKSGIRGGNDNQPVRVFHFVQNKTKSRHERSFVLFAFA